MLFGSAGMALSMAALAISNYYVTKETIADFPPQVGAAT